MNQKKLTLFLTLLIMGFCAWPVWPQTSFPAKTITMVNPFPAGGSLDVVIRIIAGEAEKTLGQKILIANKPGAGGAEGQSYVARAEPDGYTLMGFTPSAVNSPFMRPVDFTSDAFQPTILFCIDPDILFVHKGSPFQTLEDLVMQGRKEPIINATQGHSSVHHIAALLMEKKSGVKFKYVHTKGGAEQVPMVAGGHAPSGFGVWGEVQSMFEQGNIRILGVMSEERDPRFPEVPTFKEKGWPITFGSWRGIAAPKGTPREVTEKLYTTFNKVLELQEVQEKITKAGYPIVIKGPDQFTAFVSAYIEDMKPIIQDLKESK